MVNKCSAGKENVPLALATMHETTITAPRSYFPNRRDIANFKEINNIWCAISNSKKRYWKYIGTYTGKSTGDAAINGEKKTVFL